MQGVERMDRDFLDARVLVGHLVPEGSMFWFLAEHRQEVFPAKEFEDLFPSGRGRPSIPASVMASILVLQVLHDYSDRETAEAARCDLRWKVATGMPLDDPGFDASTLVYWRKRLAKSKRPHRINEAVRQVIEQTGILRGRRKRAVDSTILADAVATQDTITQLISAIRRVGRQVPGAAEQIATVCTRLPAGFDGHDYTQPGKPRIDWDDPAEREALVSALVGDASALLAALTDTGSDDNQDGDSDGDSDGDPDVEFALALLALVAGQDVEPAQGSDGTDGRWRIARRVAPDRVISTVDPDARHTRKSPEARRDGYRVHVVAEPETGIITDEQVTKAAGQENSDAAVAETFLNHENTGGAKTQPCTWYGDTAYGTGDLRGAIHDAGHDTVIKPPPLRAAVERGFTVDDFTIDEHAGTTGTVTCPAGHLRAITPSRAASFGPLCQPCPLRALCTTAKAGRILHLHPRDDLLRQARRNWAADPELRHSYRRVRPNVERVISQIANLGGRRLKLRYHGTTKNHAWLKTRTAALNLRNLIHRGLTRTAGAWILAT